MCYGVISSNSMRFATKVFLRRNDGRLITPGMGSGPQVVITRDRWILSPTPHGWHVCKDTGESRWLQYDNFHDDDDSVVRIVWVAARAALCSRGWALLYVPSDPLAGPPPAPPLNSIPSFWSSVRGYGSRQREVVARVMEHGACRVSLPKNSLYRMSRLDSIKRVLNDFGWRLKYERYPRLALVTP